MNMIKIALIYSFVLLLLPSSLIAADVNVDVSGSIRLRTEMAGQGTLGVPADSNGSWTTQQTRIEFKSKPKPNLEFFIQVQDVRTWGGEDQSFPPPSVTGTGTDASANAWDMHQGYFTLKSFISKDLQLKLGRQEIVLDDARLVGNIGWIQNAQSFDAARLTYKTESFKLNVVGAQMIAKDTHPVLTLPTNADTAYIAHDSNFYALHGEFKVGEGVISPFVYVVDKPTRMKPGSLTVSFETLQTAGLYLKQKIWEVDLKLHAGNQTGKVTTAKNHAATFYAISAGSKIADVTFAVGRDHYSGDKVQAGTESNTFNALYATNHAYFGFMDKFLFTPSTGLADNHLKVVVPSKEFGKLVLQVHSFSTADGSYDPNQAIGSEVDVTYKIKASDINWQVGYSTYTPTNTTQSYGSTGSTDIKSTWAYLQMLAKF